MRGPVPGNATEPTCSATATTAWEHVAMDLPASLLAALADDRRLAAQYGVEFVVVSRPTGAHGPSSVVPVEHGNFSDPLDAIRVGRQLAGHDVTVVANGHGLYWASNAPDEVDSMLLEMVRRDERLGPQEAEREHERDRWRDEIKRLHLRLLTAEGHQRVDTDLRKAIAALDALGPSLDTQA